MTRARRELYLTWAVTNARSWTNRPSPFFDRFPGRTAPSPKSGQKRGGRPSAPKGGETGPLERAHPGTTVECPYCTEALKGISARRLGVCAHCLAHVPGATGQRARALAEVVERAAAALGVSGAHLVTPSGLLRLLDQRPGCAEEICATPGVKLPHEWARQVAAITRS